MSLLVTEAESKFNGQGMHSSADDKEDASGREKDPSPPSDPPGNNADSLESELQEPASGVIRPKPAPLGWRFWVAFTALCATMLLSALDATIAATALPTITSSFGSNSYEWVVNAYTLSCTVFLLFIGQLADIFDRKPTMLASVFLFAVGSAVCGAATSMGMLVAGRVIQGIGGGGIPVMSELICSDMVPIVERPKYLGMLLAVAALGTVIGPPIGGAIISGTTWRWIFYLNIPLSGVAFLILSLVLKMRDSNIEVRRLSISEKMRKIDWIGNLVFAGASTAFILGLTLGGSSYSWSSANVIVPLVLGVVGYIAFGTYEATTKITSPLLPPRLVSNYTAVAIYIQGCYTTLFIAWITYFITLYFQTVLAQSPTRAGTELLPTIITCLPFSMVGGILMSKFEIAKELHMAGGALMAIGMGCFSIFNEHTSLAARVILQIVSSMGAGLLMSTLLPAVQAQLPESDVAAVTALFNFMRSFGGVWGVTIPSVIFNNYTNKHVGRVTDLGIQAMLKNGGAYAIASQTFIRSLSGVTKEQVIALYTSSLRVTWIAAAAFAASGLFLAIFEKRIPLRLRDVEEVKEVETGRQEV